MVSKIEIDEFQEEYNSIEIDDFSGMFKLIIRIVRRFLDKSRPGIMLGLIEMGYNRGSFVGGFHRLGTNEVYLNKSALRVMREESSGELYKAYLFHLMLHEYIHSNNVVDETETRQLTRKISLAIFGKHHQVGKIAILGLGSLFPYKFYQERYIPTQEEVLNTEYILLRHPDSEFTYI